MTDSLVPPELLALPPSWQAADSGRRHPVIRDLPADPEQRALALSALEACLAFQVNAAARYGEDPNWGTGTTLAAKPIIKSDRTYFDVATGLYVLNGNVYIEVGNRIIKANQAKVDLASLEVWANGGVSVTQGDIYFTGESVYVYGSQKLAQISGGVSFSRTGVAITADSVDYNWQQKVAVFSGNVNVTQGDNCWSADRVNYNVQTNVFF